MKLERGIRGLMMRNKAKQAHKSIKKICFVVLSAYSLLTGRNAKRIVGPGVHATLLAKEFLKHNFEVTFITYDDGGPPVEDVGGITVIKTYREDSHLNKILKAFYVWNAMRKAKAYIYIHVGGVAGAVSLSCRLMKKKFVYEIASDALVNRELVTQKIKEFNRSKFSIGTFGNWLDIKLADAVIVQSEYQKMMLKKNFGKDSLVIKMLFPLTKQGMPEKTKPPIVLWVGSMAEVKQPELFMKLAEVIPNAKFQMIGGHSGNQELYNRMKEASERLPNLDFTGIVPFHEINEYVSKASILVNTSMFEGFPHAFIQAWMSYMPVVSLNSDPDEIICKYRLGFHSKTFNQLIKDVRTLLKDKHFRKEMGENGRRYIKREHDITNIVKKYIELFNQKR